MDSYNVEFVLTNGQSGYPAGDFFSAALEITLKPHTPWERFCELETMVAHADSRHKAELRTLKNVVETIEAVFNHEVTRDRAFKHLEKILDELPILLRVALPELDDAIVDYAQGESA